METKSERGTVKLRVLGASKAARALGCSVWHASEVARGNRKSRRCEPVVKRMCKVVEVEAKEMEP